MDPLLFLYVYYLIFVSVRRLYLVQRRQAGRRPREALSVGMFVGINLFAFQA